MITILFYTLYKKFSRKTWAQRSFTVTKYLNVFLVVIAISFLVLLFSILPLISIAQKLQLNYTIIKGGDEIGWLRIEKKVEGNKSVMLLNSEIKFRVIFLMTLAAKESAIYENGKLVYSSQFRKTNGAIKLDKQTKLAGDKYEVLENGGKQNLAIPFIGANLLCMYFQEPLGVTAVYCENHQSFIPVHKMNDGGYQMKFPGGNINSFYYSGGTCSKIEISSTFYTVSILLNTKNN